MYLCRYSILFAKRLHDSGVVLMSQNHCCRLCGGDLFVIADKPSYLVVYTDEFGRHYCQNIWKGCSFVQF